MADNKRIPPDPEFNPDQISDFDWAYLAGLFDGEGCVDLLKPAYQPRLRIQMTDKETVEWVHNKFGGSFYFRSPPSRPKQNLDAWTWAASRRGDVLMIINRLLIYAKTKRQRLVASHDLLVHGLTNVQNRNEAWFTERDSLAEKLYARFYR